MSIEITARTATGVALHTAHANTQDDARAYMISQSAAPFVHGYSVEGIGVVIVVRTVDGHATGFRRLLNGEFVTGGPSIIFA